CMVRPWVRDELRNFYLRPRSLLIHHRDPASRDRSRTLEPEEPVWRHTKRGDKYVTVIIDLTPVRSKNGAARLLDMVEGRSKAVFKQWLAARPQQWREGVEVVAMDGFTGFKTAAAEELPDAAPIMDPFHVIRLVGDALENCRRRVQRDVFGRRGRTGDPLYRARRTLLTGAGLLTEKQHARLDEVFAEDRHVAVEATWGVYQDMITAYRETDRGLGKFFLQHTIERISAGVPIELVEVRKLARTLKQRAADVLGYFDRPGTSNGPTEAINGRLEHLRGIALGFRNLRHYIARSLLEAGGFRPRLHPRS
ncbi:Transposase, partial [Brevibacterium sp. Mu109]|uniref:ISL3 family transposase n=1 Tax=Brevibacterium sp. Mu109 TaxID=1255669 RepID=UPI000C584ACB